jgi:hypothetical protein
VWSGEREEGRREEGGGDLLMFPEKNSTISCGCHFDWKLSSLREGVRERGEREGGEQGKGLRNFSFELKNKNLFLRAAS